jgi:hypothetical protein
MVIVVCGAQLSGCAVVQDACVPASPLQRCLSVILGLLIKPIVAALQPVAALVMATGLSLVSATAHAEKYYSYSTQQSSQHEAFYAYFDAHSDVAAWCAEMAASLPLGSQDGCPGGWFCVRGPTSNCAQNAPEWYFVLLTASVCEPSGSRYHPLSNRCSLVIDRGPPPPPSCSRSGASSPNPGYGQPIYPLYGLKRTEVTLGQ